METTKKTKEMDMLNGGLAGKLILFSIPLAFSSILQQLFNSADVAVVGRFAGDQALAAVGSCVALVGIFVNLIVGLSVGPNAALANLIGQKNRGKINSMVHTILTFGAVLGIALLVIGMMVARRILVASGTPETVLDQALLYIRIYFVGIPFMVAYNFGAAIVRSYGDTRRPMCYLIVSGVLNVILNLLLVIGFHLGVAGVAIATVISNAVSAALLFRRLCRSTGAIRLDPRRLRLDGPTLRRILRIGLPAGIQSALFAISNVLIQSSVNSFGDVFMSGNAASSNIEGFVYVCLNAFQQSAVNFAGQNAGARQYRRVRQTLWICLGCVTVVGLVLGSLAYALGPSLLSIYITDSAEAISYGLIRLAFICLPYFLCIANKAVHIFYIKFTYFTIKI